MLTTEGAKQGFDATLLNYLNDIRLGVCSRCSGRPVGDPRGNPCGLELSLDQLLEALRQAQALRSGLPPSPEDAARQAGYCPCSMERMAELAAQTAADLDRQYKRQHGAMSEPLPAPIPPNNGGHS